MLGAMTLHLTVDQFEQLSQSFKQAIEKKTVSSNHRVSSNKVLGHWFIDI
jgi:hypothetical protein